MCDPLVGGLIAGAASIGAAAIQSSQMASLQSKQESANDQWVAYQNKIHQQQAAAEDQAREAANAARLDTLNKVSPQAQGQQQETEAARLNTLYSTPSGSPGDLSNPSSLLLSGEQTGNQVAGTGGQSQQDLASKVNTATQQARMRIGALATANSYGGSFGGLGNYVPQTFMQGSNYINMVNDIRQGNLKTYGVEQQVQPINYAAGPGMSAMSGLGTALAGIAGKGIGLGAAGAWGGGSGDSGDWVGPDM